ncbi:hypothetical protein ASF66_20785 [Pseudomonas sp. Leaf129]|uniref:response regulator n=1 Tax=Pseudomonas sp. Leaf129 TaxID=1736268 RepID=UPI0007027A12|nr:response regulator [Pseudomonas sp. Leaf129]KQQ56717.1 hypothetical protein ASF66_20785 [Pseudomonas sp. Leaf129]
MVPHILLVEDDKTLRYLIADALSLMDARVTECATADDALVVLLGMKTGVAIDLLLTDIRMPGELDGYDLAKAVWAKWPLIPVILMSGNRLVSTELLPPHSSFMAKPWTLDQLFEAVERHLGKRDPKIKTTTPLEHVPQSLDALLIKAM